MAAASTFAVLLERNQISFTWLTPDDPNLSDHWPGQPPAESECPALRLTDGATLIRPEPREFASQLGLQTVPRFEDYDTVIIGGGPGGSRRRRLRSLGGLARHRGRAGGAGRSAETSSRIENYLGFPQRHLAGSELASRALRQAKRLGAEEILVARKIVYRIDPHARRIVFDNEEIIRARTVIIASGVS